MIPPLSPEGLLPPGRHACTTEAVRLHFVDTFSMTNRRQLYDEWIAYTNRLQALLRVKSLVQWVDGSFVTDKPNPGDLDVVTFLPYTVYEPAEDALIEFYSTVSLYERGLDAYICPVYPTNHQRYNQYRQFRQDWQRLFESNRSLTSTKGFLEITLLYGK